MIRSHLIWYFFVLLAWASCVHGAWSFTKHCPNGEYCAQARCVTHIKLAELCKWGRHDDMEGGACTDHGFSCKVLAPQGFMSHIAMLGISFYRKAGTDDACK